MGGRDTWRGAGGLVVLLVSMEQRLQIQIFVSNWKLSSLAFSFLWCLLDFGISGWDLAGYIAGGSALSHIPQTGTFQQNFKVVNICYPLINCKNTVKRVTGEEDGDSSRRRVSVL